MKLVRGGGECRGIADCLKVVYMYQKMVVWSRGVDGHPGEGWGGGKGTMKL